MMFLKEETFNDKKSLIYTMVHLLVSKGAPIQDLADIPITDKRQQT